MLRVKELLKEQGITAKELASRIGITEGAISQSIKEGANPSLQTLTKIATALNVPISELFEQPTKTVIKCPHCDNSINIEVKEV